MAAIIQPHQWAIQPQVYCPVNRVDPRTRSLVAAIPNRWDAANNAVNSSQLGLVATPRGMLLGYYNISRYASTTVPKISGALSCFFDIIWNVGGATQGFVSQGGVSAGGGWSINSANNTNFRITYGGIADYSYSTYSPAQFELLRIGVVISGNGGTARYYVNGVFDSSRSVGTPGTATSNLLLGAAHDGSSVVNPMVAGALGNVTLFARALTDAEVLAEYRNTFFVFKPPSARIFVGPSAGGAYTLTSDAGSYTLSGQAATLTKNSVLTADAGSYSLSGQDATLTWSSPGTYVLTADAGSYTMSGQSATLLKSNVLTAAAGAYSLSGQAATLSWAGAAAYTLTANAGSYILQGQTAVLTNSGEVITTTAPVEPNSIDWGALVAKTWGKDYVKPEWDYEFSNGRRFLEKKNPYA